MNLRTLRYFVTLVREGHFARAAEQCGITQPTLSAALSAFEVEVGKQLVMRDRRYVGLTPEGEAILPWVRQVLAAHEGMAHAIEAVEGLVRGEFRLGAIPAATPAVGPFARTLLEANPALTLAVRSLTSREIERGLGAFELDAGLTYLDHEPPGDVLAVPLYVERYVFVTAETGFNVREDIDWAEVVSFPLCLLHQGMQNRRILDACLAAQGLAITPRATADSYVALLALVRSGTFATIMPDSYVAMIEGLGWARLLRITGAQPANRIGLIVPSRQPLNPLTGVALSAARETLPLMHY